MTQPLVKVKVTLLRANSKDERYREQPGVLYREQLGQGRAVPHQVAPVWVRPPLRQAARGGDN